MLKRKDILLATIPPLAILLLLYLLIFNSESGLDLSVMESLSNILSTLTTLYLTTVLVIVTYRYADSTKEQTDLLRKKYEEEKIRDQARLDAKLQQNRVS